MFVEPVVARKLIGERNLIRGATINGHYGRVGTAKAAKEPEAVPVVKLRRGRRETACMCRHGRKIH